MSRSVISQLGLVHHSPCTPAPPWWLGELGDLMSGLAAFSAESEGLRAFALSTKPAPPFLV